MNEEHNDTSEGSTSSDEVNQPIDFDQVSVDKLLPEECWRKIFSYLSIFNLITVYQAFTEWRNAIPWNKIKKLDFMPSTWGNGIASVNLYHVEILFNGCVKYLEEIDTFGSILDSVVSKTAIHLLAKYLNAKISTEEIEEPNLRTVILSDIPIDSSTINALQSICVNFTKFCLYAVESIDITECDNALYALFQQTKRLEHLEVHSTQIDGKYLLALPKDSMHTIKLDDCDILENYLTEAVKGCRNLKHFHICNIFISCGIFQVIGHHCKNVEILEFDGLAWNFEVHSRNMLELLNLHNLRVLKCGTNGYGSKDFLVNLATQCPQIVELQLKDCYITTDIEMEAIATLPKLEKLALYNIRNITDAGLRNIRGLKEFYCNMCDAITNKGILMVFYNSTVIQVLAANGKNITLNISQLFEQRALNKRHSIAVA